MSLFEGMDSEIGAHAPAADDAKLHFSSPLPVARLSRTTHRCTPHWLNVLFLGLLVRAGIQILAAYPRLYWKDGCTPGTEWLKFTARPIPRDRAWTTLEQEEAVSPLIAQPGGNNLGLGRHWHFLAALFWVVNGAVYVVFLMASDEA